MLLAVALLTGCSSGEREARRRAAGPNPSFEAFQNVASAEAGERLFGQCARCHTIGRGGPHRAGPNLHAIMNAPIAAQARYGYTAALLSKGGRWTPRAMDAWLSSPARFAPGNKMVYPGVADPLERADVIAYLRSQS